MDKLNKNIWRLVAAVSLVIGSTFALANKPEPNSFLNEPATTHSQLIAQVEKQPDVMSRYMRHFGKTRAEMLAYLKTLKPGTLSADGVYLVYNSQEWEELQAKVMFFKKGMPVWTDPNGTVILKMSCGNPMVRGTDDSSIATSNEPTLELVDEPRDLILGSDLPIPASGEAAELMSAPEIVTDLMVDSSAQGFAPVMPLLPGQLIGGTPGIGSILPIAGILPILAILGNTNGDGGPPPIPEPATMIVLGSAAASFLVAKRRRK